MVTPMDPVQQFRPCAGLIKTCILPAGNGVRVDSHIYPGYEVPSFYDPLLAKVICWGPTREVAIRRMQRALDEFVIEGITTTGMKG